MLKRNHTSLQYFEFKKFACESNLTIKRSLKRVLVVEAISNGGSLKKYQQNKL
jgi:hypothetical protein